MRHPAGYNEHISRFDGDLFEACQDGCRVLFLDHAPEFPFLGRMLEPHQNVRFFHLLTDAQNNICFCFTGVAVQVFFSKRDGRMALDMQPDGRIEELE